MRSALARAVRALRAPHNPRYVQVPARVVRFAAAALVAPRVIDRPRPPTRGACSASRPRPPPRGGSPRAARWRAPLLRAA